jgi:cytochrome c-type biogenesis protein CcmE
MNPVRRRRLVSLIFILTGLSLAILLVMYALRQNISLFFTPEQLVHGDAPINHSIRIGGMVVPGSIHRSDQGLTTHFQVTDYKNTVRVIYHGVLPDLFREGQGVVAFGTYDPVHQQVNASEVLAKHDEKYMPPEVKQALAKNLQKDALRL